MNIRVDQVGFLVRIRSFRKRTLARTANFLMIAVIASDLSPKSLSALRGVLGITTLVLGRHLVHRFSLQKFHWRQVAQC